MSDTTLCDLCGATSGLDTHAVPPDATITVCDTCGPQLAPGADLNSKHWFCLQESIWSEVPAVQVVSYRLLKRLAAETWAQDLLEQAYLEDSVLAWAQSDEEDDGDSVPGQPTLDSNGTALQDGDAVTLIKDLVVKGANFTAKRGTLVKSIRLTDNPKHVEGKVNKVAIVLVAAFLKKTS